MSLGGGHRVSLEGLGHRTLPKPRGPTMTDETMNLQTLLEKTTDTDFLREMTSFTAQRLMALEVETLTEAAGRPDAGSAQPQRLPRSRLADQGRIVELRNPSCVKVAKATFWLSSNHAGWPKRR